MRVRTIVALALAAAVASAGAASAAPGAGGTGSAIDIVGVTAVSGPLLIGGAGLTVGTSLTQSPGSFSSSPISGGALLVSDLRASNLGWYVTATYSAPPALIAAVPSISLGGANVKVVASNPVPDAVQGGVSAGNVTLAPESDLTNPVTVASTGTNAGSGLTTLSTAYKVRIPADVSTVGLYAGTVTYTVASVR